MPAPQAKAKGGPRYDVVDAQGTIHGVKAAQVCVYVRVPRKAAGAQASAIFI